MYIVYAEPIFLLRQIYDIIEIIILLVSRITKEEVIYAP